MTQRRGSFPYLLSHNPPMRQSRWFVLLALLAAILRTLWLGWQPLWWDEGYSIYFATESIQRMVQLTADDIHPPLYYLLLHGWLVFGVNSIYARLFSVVIGALTVPLFALLTTELYPQRQRLTLIATGLLLLNPLHLYYSQEVRMVGLALFLSIASTYLLARAIRQLQNNESGVRALLLYGLSATLCLYTLYYLGFLLLAHGIWALWQMRQRRSALGKLCGLGVGVILAYLPWLLYAGMRLTQYVQHKVASDKDRPLSFAEFGLRHLGTFITGHLAGTNPFAHWESWLTFVILALLLAMSIRIFVGKRRGKLGWSGLMAANTSLLWLAFLVPFFCAFLINQRSPFFPENGERLLLFILPYFLLLLALGIDVGYDYTPHDTPHGIKLSPSAVYLASRIIFVLILTVAISGIVHFYTTPRYNADDYRPLLRQIVEQSSQQDTYLATYPWQIGFWRAYTTANAQDNAQPLLLSDGSVEWNATTISLVEQAFQRGIVWFPSLLSIGSSLPDQVNHYFAERESTRISERWFSETTRLDAWHKSTSMALTETEINFGRERNLREVAITGIAVTPRQVKSANQLLDVHLRWTISNPAQKFNLSKFNLTIRLQDAEKRIWLQRDRLLTASLNSALNENRIFSPEKSLEKSSSHFNRSLSTDSQGVIEAIGLIVPPGIPPGNYQLMLGVSDENENIALAIQPSQEAIEFFTPLATVTVEQPESPLSPAKLPIRSQLNPPIQINGITLLGYSGADRQMLAGEPVNLTLFYQKQPGDLPAFDLFISLLDRNGGSVAGWQGWQLPDYTTSVWHDGALVQVPVEFDLPATVASGKYQLVTGLINLEKGEKSKLVELGTLEVHQRHANFAPVNPPKTLSSPPLLGNHATLLGYETSQTEEGIEVQLYWHVEQPLLPAHHIFVHFDDKNGTTLAQIDGAPRTTDGRAPTGSWQPNERLITIHQLSGNLPAYDLIRVGLYNPETNQRLPVSVQGKVMGDAVILQ